MRPMFCSTTQKNEVLFFFDMCLRGVGKNILNHLSLNGGLDGDLPPKKRKTYKLEIQTICKKVDGTDPLPIGLILSPLPIYRP